MTGEELKGVRVQMGFTQMQMARALNVSFATLNRWENGRNPVSTETARLLQCLQPVVASAKKRKSPFDLKELREAALTTGIAGVVATAAIRG